MKPEGLIFFKYNGIFNCQNELPPHSEHCMSGLLFMFMYTVLFWVNH
jgi:hypothetical protein